MQLHSISPTHKRKSKKRIARGGKRGTYSGRGQKGQLSRAGSGHKPDFRGGDKPLWKAFPKQRGATKKVEVKHRRFSKRYPKPSVINLLTINEVFIAGETVSKISLLKKGLITTGKNGVKILGEGEVDKKLVFEGVSLSSYAREKIERAGGNIKKE